MSPERPDQDDDFLEDEEHEEYGQRSIFATGWFRAVLVLLVLAVIAVIAVPLIGGWFEPTPPSKVTTKPPDQPAVVPVPSTPSAPPAVTPPPAQMPATATPPPSTPPPTAAVPSTPALPPSSTPPATPTPAPAKPETPPASTKAAEKAPEKAKAPERTASAKSTAKAASGGSYWVQVGAFKEVRNAEGLAKALRSEGFAVQVAKVTREDTLHVVRVGGYPDRTKARAAREELEGKGHSGFVTQGPAK